MQRMQRNFVYLANRTLRSSQTSAGVLKSQLDYTASSLIRHLANSRGPPAIAVIRIQVSAFTAKFSPIWISQI